MPSLLSTAQTQGRGLLLLSAGASVDYSATNLTYFAMAEAVLELADALNITRPDIFGHSMGASLESSAQE